MFRMTCVQLLAAAVALVFSACGFAQGTLPEPQKMPSGASDVEQMLQGLPHPPDQPASLLAPASPPGPAGILLDSPSYLTDPRVNPPYPPSGWFAGVELDVLKPHLENQLINTVQNSVQVANGTSTTVALPSTTSIGRFPLAPLSVTAFQPGGVNSPLLTGAWPPQATRA